VKRSSITIRFNIVTEELARRRTGYGPADFEVPPDAVALIEEAVPQNTALAYGSRWRSFEAWCAGTSRVALPATPQTVAAYLTYLATERGLKATTADAHLTAIRTVHRASGEQPPDGLAARNRRRRAEAGGTPRRPVWPPQGAAAHGR
jgi:hypothetical protein